ncbi:MAG: glycosyltransferase family 2 protein [Paludibacter sp.]|nr:glycosyltransferase family 2 protein [Paludibacter sp.]
MHKISAVIITYNEELRVRRTLESVKWCDEIIVVDSCSTDKTVDICNEYSNCKVYSQPFLGYGLQKKFAVDQATNNWVISIDADEVMTDALIKEIKMLLNKPVLSISGFYIPLKLVFMNKEFKYGNVKKLCLFDKTKGNFDSQNLHEVVHVSGKTIKLRRKILHYSYKDIHHYISKMNDYTTIYAKERSKNGKRVSRTMSIFRFSFEFTKQYFLECNFLNGYAGFVWSILSSSYVFVKLAKLHEINS